MDRLTEKRDNQNVIPLRKNGETKWAICSAGMGDAPTEYLYGEHADRLAAYEDTGLEPCDYSAMAHALEQAERAREDLTEMIRQIGATGLDRLRELDQADREGQCFIGPFVAMIEQSLSGGEMKPQRDQRFNGRYAVVYFDPKKWSSPLIDICGTPYNREEAEERMKVLKAALRREQDEKGGSSE